ncbi:hypothetical protein PRK78_005775 [Emydomyces testavorans]|uniref:Uncharacterized protein n=1 Tax=Emydomyces testavorans TaxID=2070801 RepID=A0AAF0DP43_9EURO|nr:hypothetical protein PRK78_005775 [Emydomyces testavorans]
MDDDDDDDDGDGGDGDDDSTSYSPSLSLVYHTVAYAASYTGEMRRSSVAGWSLKAPPPQDHRAVVRILPSRINSVRRCGFEDPIFAVSSFPLPESLPSIDRMIPWPSTGDGRLALQICHELRNYQ